MTPSGIEMAAETKVTAMDATIRGKMPKSGGLDVGYQYFPKIKSFIETILKTGKPSMKRNNIIINRMAKEAKATLKKKKRTDLSVLPRLFFIVFAKSFI
jgi:hypothetical protein